MDSPRKLTPGELHVLRLILRDANPEGWTTVSRVVAPLFTEKESGRPGMPKALCEFEASDDGSGRARLTDQGISLLAAQAWL